MRQNGLLKEFTEGLYVFIDGIQIWLWEIPQVTTQGCGNVSATHFYFAGFHSPLNRHKLANWNQLVRQRYPGFLMVVAFKAKIFNFFFFLSGLVLFSHDKIKYECYVAIRQPQVFAVTKYITAKW